MPQGQFYPTQILEEAVHVFDGRVNVRYLKGGGAAPTIAAGSQSGSTGAVSQQAGTDMAGSFVVTPGGSGIGAGTLATVVFGTPLTGKPAAVIADVADETAPGGSIAAGAGAITSTGFSVLSAAATSGHIVRVCYVVIQQ